MTQATLSMHTAPAHTSLASYQNRPLRVLQIHNFYQQTGGEDVVVHNEALLLQQAGVELFTWYVDSAAINHSSNNSVGNGGSKSISWFSRLQLAGRLLWNRQAQQQLKQRLQQQPVDIIHLHNSFPLLSPAIMHTAQQLGMPLVLTVHNFRWCHPAACISSLADAGKSPWRYLGQRLYRNSRFATALMVLHIQLHQWLGSYQRCARLLCPSQFVKTALLQAGFHPQLLQLKPHSVAAAVASTVADTVADTLTDKVPSAATAESADDPAAIRAGFALFVGRADAGKGLYFLLKAWQQQDYPLWIAGVTEQQAQQWPEYQPNPHVRFLGPQTQSALSVLYQQATLLLVPSLVAETFGNVVIEAFSHGTPCLVSNIGALPELLLPRHNVGTNAGTNVGTNAGTSEDICAGQVFLRGDQEDFLNKLKVLLGDPALLKQMSQQARLLFQSYYLPQHNQQALLACYQQVLAEQGKVVGG